MAGQSRHSPATQRQQLVEVVGIPGYMTTMSGGEVEAETSKAWDGGSLRPDTLAGPAETSNVTVSKLYRAPLHASTLLSWSKRVGRLRTTISIYDTDVDLGPIGRPRVHADALLVKLTWPESDAASSDASMFELEFATDGAA